MLDLKKLKKIELVLFDVDGTLVNDNGDVGERTKQLIRDLKKLGVRFSFASGRLHSALVPIAEELKLYSPLISLDGSAIKSVTGKQFVYRSFIKQKHVKQAIEYSEKYLVNLAPVSYTHLRAHETVLDLVCRLLLEKKKIILNTYISSCIILIN